MPNYVFGSRSLSNLETCHDDLQMLMKEVLIWTPIDFSIIEGHRALERQQQLFEQGMSKLDGVTKVSLHQNDPSHAVDIAPYPIDWDGPFAHKRFYWLAGAVIATANRLGIKIRWGGDWNGNSSFTDQKFHDLPHFELRGT